MPRVVAQHPLRHLNTIAHSSHQTMLGLRASELPNEYHIQSCLCDVHGQVRDVDNLLADEDGMLQEWTDKPAANKLICVPASSVAAFKPRDLAEKNLSPVTPSP